MSTQFRMDSVPGSLVVVGGTYEPWLAVLEKVGWRCTQVADLRKAECVICRDWAMYWYCGFKP